MFISGKAYTNFRAVNNKGGKMRLSGGTLGGVALKVDQGDITADRVVYFGNGAGTAMVNGYHCNYGTSSFSLSSNTVGANGIMSTVVTLTGVHTTSVIIIKAESTATVEGYVPYGARCTTDGQAVILVHCLAASVAAKATIPFSYIILHPQTY